MGGIERWQSRNDATHNARYIDYAEEYGLIVTDDGACVIKNRFFWVRSIY